ncbi:MAG: alpha/beta hydrolase [Acidobacteria bacterium]|nr:alpha/beta hydrolase [Acidobacteriota bacterium]
MPYVHIRGIDLYYEEHGSGPHLIVAHGALGSVATAPVFGLHAADIAARGLHVVSYDARGHGRSGYTTRREDYHWTALADDMHGLIDALGLERTSIYGSSMGAGAALMFTLAHPTRVDRLVLRNPPAFEIDLKGPSRRLSGLMFLYRYFGAPVTAHILTMLPGPAPRDRMRALLRAQRPAAIVLAIQGLLSSQPLPAERLTEIEAPALVLTQPHDVMHPLRSGEILRERMRHAKLAVASSLTYWQQNPDVLTHVIASFVKERGS